MKDFLARFPVRCGLLIATLGALVVVMWNAWPGGALLITMFVFQAVDLARLRVGDVGPAVRMTKPKAH